MMPSYVEEIVSGMKDLEKFQGKASKNGLPQVILFPSKDKTMPLVKYLSTEFRRKILLGEVKPTKKNKEVMDKFGVTELPALIVLPISSSDEAGETKYEDAVRYERKKEDFTRHKLHSFLSKYALKKIVVPKKSEEKKEEKTAEKTGVKEEL